MTLLYCSVFFAAMAVPERHRFEWAVLAVLAALTWFNKEAFDHNGSALYYVRAFLTFGAAIALSRVGTFLGYYQASILLLTLLAYCALAYRAAEGSLYASVIFQYKEAIYALVMGQFIGVLPTLRGLYCDLTSSGRFSRKHISGSTRT